jgi:hypothetical protein
MGTDGPLCTTCNGSGTLDEVQPETGKVVAKPCPAGCNGGRQQ